MGTRVFTDEEKRQIADEWIAGKSSKTLCREWNVGQNRIECILIEMGMIK